MGKLDKKIELWVGIFVILVILSFLFIAVKVTNISAFDSSDSYRLHANFKNIGSLKANAKVSMSGVLIGRVNRIVLDSDTFYAVVYFDIDSKYDNIPIDSSASILTSGILGDQYVGIDAGADDIALEEGDSIELTQSALVLEDLINNFVTRFTQNPD